MTMCDLLKPLIAPSHVPFRMPAYPFKLLQMGAFFGWHDEGLCNAAPS